MNDNRCPHCGTEFDTSRTCSCIDVVYIGGRLPLEYIGGQLPLEPAVELIGFDDIDLKLSDILDRLRRIEALLLYLEEDSHN